MITKFVAKIHYPLLRNSVPINSKIFTKKKNPLCTLTYGIKYHIGEQHKYSNKTTKEIQKQMGKEKWKNLQNTFNSLNTSFGLKKPSLSDLQNNKYASPSKLEYNLQNLRLCSHSYPVYLYYELQKSNSPYNLVIGKVIDNLWKAQKNQALQFLQFLYAWQYKMADLQSLYRAIINNFELSMSQIFAILKKFEGKLHDAIQVKVIERLNKSDLLSDEYSHLLRIVSYFTVKEIISEQFSLAVLRVIRQNINKIPPGQALQAYVYYTYNINQHMQQMQKIQTSQEQKANEEGKQKQDTTIQILKIIEKRLLSQQCIKFYNGDQFVALLHTFMKNNLILNDKSITEQYQRKIDTIVTRIQLSYISNDFSTKNKKSLLEICSLLPELKKKSIIAIIQNQFYKKGEKFDYLLLPSLYLISHQNGMLTSQFKGKVENIILDHIFQLDKKDISKILWLFTITATNKLKLIHQKVETIIEGGLKQFEVMDVSIIVWSMCSTNYNQAGKFWDNIQSYIIQQLQRKFTIKQSDGNKNNRKLVTECSWILWAYHNNRQLRLQTIDLIANIIMSQFGKKQQTQNKQSILAQAEKLMSVFQLTSITSFYYSLNFPSQTIQKQIQIICFDQFTKIYTMMSPIQLCRCLKYMGPSAWKNKTLADGILSIFQAESQNIIYQDIITVVGIIIGSSIKNKRTTALITKLLQRKKRLQSLEQFGQNSQAKQGKNNSWKFPI